MFECHIFTLSLYKKMTYSIKKRRWYEFGCFDVEAGSNMISLSEKMSLAAAYTGIHDLTFCYTFI